MKKMQSANILSWVVIGMALCALSLVGWWKFYPYDVIIEHGAVQTTKQVFAAGEDISYMVDITQLTNGITFTVLRSIEGPTMLKQYPPYIYITKRGRLNTIVYFPPGLLPSGRYRVVNRIIAHLNPVRDVVIERTSNEFEVKGASVPMPPQAEEFSDVKHLQQ